MHVYCVLCSMYLHIPPLFRFSVIHLRRFDLDYETFETVKLNDRFMFPMRLDMAPYIDKGAPTPPPGGEGAEEAGGAEGGEAKGMDVVGGEDDEGGDGGSGRGTGGAGTAWGPESKSS